jgi:hypothetical protein
VSPRLFLLRVVEPGLALLPGYMVSNAARVALMAIAGQETNWAARAQIGGQALGYWQFQADGLDGVLTKQGPLMAAIFKTLDVAAPDAHIALQFHDPLACAVARLLLWSDPEPLPAIGDVNGCWNYYTRNWRPGKPDATRWAPAYAMAVSTVTSEG